MLACTDEIPAYVECCTHLDEKSDAAVTAEKAVDPAFLRFYAIYQRMQTRLGAERSERLFSEFVDSAI